MSVQINNWIAFVVTQNFKFFWAIEVSEKLDEKFMHHWTENCINAQCVDAEVLHPIFQLISQSPQKYYNKFSISFDSLN